MQIVVCFMIYMGDVIPGQTKLPFITMGTSVDRYNIKYL